MGRGGGEDVEEGQEKEVEVEDVDRREAHEGVIGSGGLHEGIEAKLNPEILFCALSWLEWLYLRFFSSVVFVPTALHCKIL